MNSAAAPSRRTVVTAGVAASAAALPLHVLAATPASAAEAPAFHHGVASGDPLSDGVLLWTRVTPVADAVPGSGTGPDIDVEWEIAEDADFRTVLAHGSVTATAASDHTVKADVRGLGPDTAYHYRFTADGVRSPAGRTRTAPQDHLRLGVVSCSNYEAGYFAAYRHLAGREDLHAVVHLGDYIYEYASGEYPDDPVREQEPAHEIVSLADYRTRHGHYRTDADLQSLHAAHPVIAIWDDHETANDSWSGGAENHTEGEEGTWTDRRAAGVQAYFEWMPVRPAIEGTTYRRLQFGDLADLFLLDLRSFRDQQADTGDDEVDSADRTITGRAQMEWLTSGLASSTARWRLIGNSVMIAPVAFGSVPAYLLGPLGEILGIPDGGLAISTDQWDGYTADRQELLDLLDSQGITNIVFLTGDIHMHWANDVPLKAATYPDSPSVAAEFVVASVTSDNLDDYLGVPPQTLSPIAAAAIKAENRHVKWVDLDSHGYGVLDVTAERAGMDYFILSDRTDPDATASRTRSYQTLSGEQSVSRVSDAIA